MTDAEVIDSPDGTHTDRERMVTVFHQVFRDHPDYYAIRRTRVRFVTDADAYQWTYGVDFHPEAVRCTATGARVDPDGLTYADGGVLVESYDGSGYRDLHIAVRTEAPERGVNVAEKQDPVQSFTVQTGETDG